MYKRQDDDCAGGAQARDECGVALRVDAVECERTGCGGHTVAGGDVVLEEDGDALQRAGWGACAGLSVQAAGNLQGVWVEFDDAVEVRAASVERGDAG